uniref:Uncharacterized protein n=1 Tax=Chlamydomonas euryale TaxID=1486919 RepID=A0A7R9VLD2_9CHLO|mmetsp:Transcript_39016/g.116091  ORF Transcript_39016/g.116091 Transcript_39016/m.116091 type:complete len:145 (+) Transcript_39016:503-937(+)
MDPGDNLVLSIILETVASATARRSHAPKTPPREGLRSLLNPAASPLTRATGHAAPSTWKGLAGRQALPMRAPQDSHLLHASWHGPRRGSPTQAHPAALPASRIVIPMSAERPNERCAGGCRGVRGAAARARRQQPSLVAGHRQL